MHLLAKHSTFGTHSHLCFHFLTNSTIPPLTLLNIFIRIESYPIVKDKRNLNGNNINGIEWKEIAPLTKLQKLGDFVNNKNLGMTIVGRNW